MQHFPTILSRSESDQLVTRIPEYFYQYGFGLWALEIPGELPFAGFVGLLRVSFDAHFTPAVEIGWRLTRSAWGKSYATEAAQCVLKYAFEVEQLQEIVSFTVPANLRSQAVMQRLGMHTRLRIISNIRNYPQDIRYVCMFCTNSNALNGSHNKKHACQF
jgi:RimJ/RimL family protein N-acetyltransferase